MRGIAPLGAQCFLRVYGKCFNFNNYSSMNEIFRSDGRNMVNSVSFKSGEFSENNAVLVFQDLCMFLEVMS